MNRNRQQVKPQSFIRIQVVIAQIILFLHSAQITRLPCFQAFTRLITIWRQLGHLCRCALAPSESFICLPSWPVYKVIRNTALTERGLTERYVHPTIVDMSKKITSGIPLMLMYRQWYQREISVGLNRCQIC